MLVKSSLIDLRLDFTSMDTTDVALKT